MVCFGRPAPSEKEKEHPPAAEAGGKGPKEANGSLPGADATRALPATHKTDEAPPPEQPSSDHQEIRQEAVASERRAVERDIGESLNGEVQDVDRPDADVPNGEVPSGDALSGEKPNAEEEPSREVPTEEGVSEPVGGENVSREGGDMSSSAPAATAGTTARTSAATAGEGEMPEENGALAGPLPTTEEGPDTVALGGERISKDSPNGRVACVEQNGGGVEDFGEAGAPEPNDATGVPRDGEVATAKNEAGDMVNVCDRNECNGETPNLEISNRKAASREFRESSLFLFGDKPFESSMG